MNPSRFDAEVERAGAHTKALQHEAELQRELRQARPRWRTVLAAQLRAAAERLEPQPTPNRAKPKGIL